MLPTGRNRLTFVVTAALALHLGTAPSYAKRPDAEKISDALARLKTCQNIRANVCVVATATLTNAGDAGLPKLQRHLRTMTAPGQILAMSIFENVNSRRSTLGLVYVVRDRKLPIFARTMAIRTLGERESRKIVPTLIQQARDKNPVIRAAAVRVLGNRAHGNQKRVIKTLLTCARDEDATVRLEAVVGLGLSRHDKGGPVLTEALGDKNRKVRLAAAKGLCHVKYSVSVLPLIESLKTRNPTLKTSAANALTFQTGKNLGESYRRWKGWYTNR